MRIERLFSLPVPQSGCGDVRVHATSVELLVEYEYRADGRDLVGGLRFESVVAYQFHGEIYARTFVPEAYDCLVKIEPSIWLSSLPHTKGGGGDFTHFAVLFSSNGYLEVLAGSWTEVRGREGVLDTLV